jgi:hypothetical protein
MFLEYTHDEHCNMLLTGTACNTDLVLMHRNTSYVTPVNAVQTFVCSDEWISVFMTGSVTPIALVNTGYLQTIQTSFNEHNTFICEPKAMAKLM